jgi:hypothetical protein
MQGVKKALQLAEEKDPQGKIRGLQSDLGKANAVLSVSRSPKDMLNVWLPQIAIGTRVAADAARDADRVLHDPDAKPELKAQAECLKALVDWSQERWAQARPKLEKGLAALPARDSAWRQKVGDALKVAANPSAYYLDAAQDAEARGKAQEALGKLNAALELIPQEDRAPVFLYRAGLLLNQARTKNDGKLSASDVNLNAARKDLAAAAKAGFPQGNYLLGQIAEELGSWKEAEAAYRAAVKGAPKVAGAGSTYRVALARVLLRERPGRPAGGPPVPVGPAPMEEPKPAPKAADKEDKSTSRFAPAIDRAGWESLLGLVAVGLQFTPQTQDPAQQEAIKLADEILAAPANQVPFEARAKALAIKGQWSRALQTYVDGLRPHLKREHAEGLSELIRNHPILKRPELPATADGSEAEKHYADGLRHYFARRFSNAEKEFNSAIEQENQDARFFYFLGLARLAQNNRDAYEDFEQAAKLELQDRPGRAAVSQALERVQGKARKVLNQVRDTAAE